MLSNRLERLFGPLPGSREARAISVMAIAAGLVLCGMSLYRGARGEKFFGRWLGGDFVEFYAAGKVLNDTQPARVYDLEFMNRVMHESVPAMDKGQMLPYLHGPYLGPLFQPFSALPYVWGYVAWLIFSLALYVFSLRLLKPEGVNGTAAATGFLLAVSSPLYLFETWIGGQISVVALLIWALFFHFRSRGREFTAGVILAFVAYKPTLLIIPAGMLVIGRAWRTVAGLIAGGLAVVALSFATFGIEGCSAWLQVLRMRSVLTSQSNAMLRYTKSVDIYSFLRTLTGMNSLSAVLSGIVVLTGLIYLGRGWWRSSSLSSRQLDLLWSATLAWSLMFNGYTPIYDAILLVPAATLAYSGVRDASEDAKKTFQWWLVLLYLAPWITQSGAEFLRVQLLTIVVTAFGWWTLSNGTSAQRTMTPLTDRVSA